METPDEFEDWIRFVFDRPVADPAWHWDISVDDLPGPPEAVVRLLTETFERSGDVLAAYSDAQTRQGLWYLIDGCCSSYVHGLKDPGVPLDARLRCILSMYTLFRDGFGPRCSAHLSHLDEPGSNPLNGVCDMWWDLFPVAPEPADPDRVLFDAAVVQTMARCLELDSDACRESALHGLGHWLTEYPRIAGIITRFLAEHRGLRKELRLYAREASTGMIQ